VKPRFAHGVDANHTPVVNALRSVGAWVYDAAGVGEGFPDLLVWFRGAYHLLEVKDGSKKPSARRLRKTQVNFQQACPGPVHVVNSPEEALKAIGAVVTLARSVLPPPNPNVRNTWRRL
jgi:hypothetical protein